MYDTTMRCCVTVREKNQTDVEYLCDISTCILFFALAMLYIGFALSHSNPIDPNVEQVIHVLRNTCGSVLLCMLACMYVYETCGVEDMYVHRALTWTSPTAQYGIIIPARKAGLHVADLTGCSGFREYTFTFSKKNTYTHKSIFAQVSLSLSKFGRRLFHFSSLHTFISSLCVFGPEDTLSHNHPRKWRLQV